MTFMPWSSEIAVGLSDVDEQHRWLVDRINQLHSELSEIAPRSSVIADVLEELMDYTMNHFIRTPEKPRHSCRGGRGRRRRCRIYFVRMMCA